MREAPRLATDTVSEDALTWSVTLRDGLRFPDGPDRSPETVASAPNIARACPGPLADWPGPAARWHQSPSTAVAAALTAGSAGLILGTLAVARRGWIDRTLTLLADALRALRGLLLVLIVPAIEPDTALGFRARLSLVLRVEFFRLTRAAARDTLASPAVQASRLPGFGPVHISPMHIRPEIAPMMLVAATFDTATAIMAIAALTSWCWQLRRRG